MSKSKETTMWSRGDSPFDIILGGYQIRNILEHARGNSLLDLGCNDGSLLEAIVAGDEFTKVVGIDADANKISKAIRFLRTEKDMSFICSFIEDFKNRKKFDTIILINIMEHIEDPILVLQKAREWLSAKGVIIIHVPNALSLNRQLGLAMGLIQDLKELGEKDISPELGHRRFYDYWTLKKDVEEAGLKVHCSGGVFVKLFSNTQMQRIADEWDNAGEIFEGLHKMAKKLPHFSSPLFMVCTK